MALSSEELMELIENNQSTIMFLFRGRNHEEILRNSTGQLERYAKALDKYPPIYGSDILPFGFDCTSLAEYDF